VVGVSEMAFRRSAEAKSHVREIPRDLTLT